MSSTAIDFPSNRSQLDPSLNSPPFDDVPLLDGDIFVAAGSSYTWTLDTGETYGRWRNEDPGATGDGRYVKLEDAGKTQVINGGGVLSINDKITLNGGDGSVDMAAVNTSTYQTGVRAETNTGNTTLTVYGDSTNDFGAFVVYDGQAADKTKVRINNNGSAEFAGDVQLGGNAKAGESGIKLEVSGLVSAARAGTAADGAGLAVFGGYNGGSSTATSSIRNDGSASFAGDLNQGESWNRTANQRSVLITGGAVYAQRNSTDGSNPVFRGTLSTTDSSDAAITSQINADGSAKFSGTVVNTGSFVVDRDDGSKGIISGRLNGTTTSYINADGSSYFAGTIEKQNTSVICPDIDGLTVGETVRTSYLSTDYKFYRAGWLHKKNPQRDVTWNIFGSQILPKDTDIDTISWTPKITLSSNGSATFAGDVDFGSYNAPNDTNGIGAKIYPTGNIYLRNDGGPVIRGYNKGVDGPTSEITAGGSATFTGAVEANGGFTVNGVGVFSIFQALRTAVDSATNFDDLKAAMQQALSDFGSTPTPQPAPTPEPTPEPTPDPTNLIPDDWTHIEKLKALKELITEMDL